MNSYLSVLSASSAYQLLGKKEKMETQMTRMTLVGCFFIIYCVSIEI